MGLIASRLERASSAVPAPDDEDAGVRVPDEHGAAVSPTAVTEAQPSSPAATQATTAPVGRRSVAPGRALLLALPAVALAVGLFAFVRARHAPSPAPSIPSSAPTASGPVTVLDLPVPSSTSSEALAQYRHGLEAERAADNRAALNGFDEAARLDPTLAQAWLRFAMFGVWSGMAPAARDAYQHLAPLASRLDAHDQALLDAYESVVLRDPPDVAEYARRLRQGAERFPMDAELAVNLAYALYRQASWAAAAAVYDRAITLDPGQAESYRFKASCQGYLGDEAGALATGDACERACPRSSMCPFSKQPFSEQAGDCAAVEAEGRAIALRDPGGQGYTILAEALASQGRSPDAVREALMLHVAHMPENLRDLERRRVEVALSAWAGDFTTAEKQAIELETFLAGDDSEAHHASAVLPLLTALLESGKAARARKAAASYIERRAMWTSSAKRTSRALTESVDPLLLEAELAGGAPAADVERARDAFAESFAKALPTHARGAVWLAAYAAPAETVGAAARAKEMLVSYEPLPPFRAGTMWNAGEGYARVLWGDAAHGLPLLERGARACLALGDTRAHVRAQLHLGIAREASGDKDGACEAYARVIGRWGKATPRSVTAEEAARRARTLGCPSAR